MLRYQVSGSVSQPCAEVPWHLLLPSRNKHWSESTEPERTSRKLFWYVVPFPVVQGRVTLGSGTNFGDGRRRRLLRHQFGDDL